ncbi:MAG: ATP-binding cassette domain-containing protein [Candidatus Dormibacteria bacterium]
MSLLTVDDVRLSFGGIRALNGISLQLNQGEILGLIGPNGAGKTTLFNCISGVLVPDSGEIRFDGRNLLRLKPHERARRGIARTFQDLQLWGSMTVLENCQTPMDALSNRSMIADAFRLPSSHRLERVAEERARAILHFLRLSDQADRLAGDLPVGLQRRVEIARALCMKPSLLLLDEPASGLDAGETAELADLLAAIRERFKVSMLLVDHDMSLVMRACHYIYVLDFGDLISRGRPEQVREDQKVISAYLGEATDAEMVEQKPVVAASKKRARGKAVVNPPAELAEVVSRAAAPLSSATGDLLEVLDLSAGYGHISVVRDVSFVIAPGEVVACIGANGAGKTTTLRAISGVIKPTGGSVRFGGAEVTGRSAQALVRLGMMHIPQGRGLFPKLSVHETLRLAAYSGHEGSFDEAFDAFPVLKRRLSQLVGTLSGGEQQMVAMARALLVKPRLLLLDEMSQGLAPAVVQQLFERIELFRSSGTAVFLVEQFVDAALAIADRGYVFEQGTVAHTAGAAILRQDQGVIASSYLGTAGEVRAAPETGPVRGSILASMDIRLPAEVKRAIEERATDEGRSADEVVRDLLETAGPTGRGRVRR